MKKVLAGCLSLLLTTASAAQTPPSTPQTPTQDEEVLRVTTELVQVDAVVMDKNDQPLTDLKLSDFDVYDNGKKQDLQFMELVSVDAGSRSEGSLAAAKIAPGIDTSVARDLSARDVHRVVAFVIDDVTIPNEDIARVRQMLTDFVDNKMRDGDLVAIIRTVGGKGLLEQFTGDKQILRRAIAQLGPVAVPPYLALTDNDPGRIVSPPSPFSDATATQTINSSNSAFEGPSEGTNQVPRALLALSVSSQVVDSLREIPGRKNLVLVSGGLPLFELGRNGAIIGDITPVFRALTDNALRSGVVINTLDARGLQANGAVAKFDVTPAKSALGGGTFAGSDENTAGRVDTALLGEQSLTEQLTLRSLAGTTGGVAVVNANNFTAGLDRVLARSRAYYRLAFRPSERFDNKFHKIEVRVRRSGARVYTAEGFYARADVANTPSTKEGEIIRAARSPLAKRDLDVAADLQYRFTPDNKAQVDINAVIDAHKLTFAHTPEGKYQTTFDVVGFIFDQSGRSRGGISQTVNATLTEEEYRRALIAGIPYTASTQATPGYYQARLVVRESATGNIGTISRYFEVPDLNAKRLTVASLFFYGIDPTGANKTPEPLTAARVISRKQDLRYAVAIYNAREEAGKTQLRTRMIVSQGGKILFEEPEQPVTGRTTNGQIIKIGQLGLSKVVPGRYVLTLVVTDPLADKNRQIVARSLEFTVVN
jgi:VWFA-related protein